MYISKNWLKEFVDIPNKLTPEELMSKMTISSVEVEEVRDLDNELKGVVVAEILEVKPHPDADKLQVAIVSDGKKKLNIVCGAPNIAAGQKVPLATVGTFLHSLDFTIEERKVRGEVSQGMLCAPDEIGLGTDHAGILILDDSLKVGEPLSKALKLDDWIIEIDNKSMTHRPDMWGHYGIAREVSAFLNIKLKEYLPVNIKEDSSDKIDVKVDDKKACPRYMATVIDGIQVQESPQWLKTRLESIGQQSINNIVDITNYVMYELGQPLHAFDFNNIEGEKIIVTKAKKGEKVITLDDKDLELSDQDLVIKDSKKVLAIAGIKGLKNSGITDSTRKIVLESANFDHITIRKSSNSLGLRTDSSARYEKSLDPNLTELALKRAVELILELNPDAKVTSKVIDVSNFKLDQGPIKTSVQYIENKIGMQIGEKQIINILQRLGFEVAFENEELSVVIPTWRATKDITDEFDLVEEVARIFGYDNITPSLPATLITRPMEDKLKIVINKVKDICAYGFDMSEVYNYSFVSEKSVKGLNLNPDLYVRILNPQSKGLELLRRDLMQNLADQIGVNFRNYDHFNMFEVGKTFIKEQEGDVITKDSKKHLPKQDTNLAGVIYDKGDKEPFYTAKNIVATLLHRLHFTYELKIVEQVPYWANIERSMEVLIDGESVGYISELNPAITKGMKIKERVGAFEINLNKLSDKYSDIIKYSSIPKFPAIEMDVALLVDKEVLWGEVEKSILDLEKELVQSVELFDVYEGENIPSDKKSLAFRITYRSDDRTLETKEVDKLHNEIKEGIAKELKGEIR